MKKPNLSKNKSPKSKKKLSSLNFPQVSRSTLISRNHLGKNFLVHNGKSLVKVAAVPLRLGTKFGAYSFTRVFGGHLKKKKKKK
jgi:ribosomal protein S19